MIKNKELLMGNEAIAMAAIDSGVSFVSGYPGTPSTEILETIIKANIKNVYSEWSVNEKVAFEFAAGASISGYRSLVTMKQVGLNVCSDAVMNLSYIGTKGGLVIVVADDPGPMSSQTEQDTRNFAYFSKLPLFDPSSVQEAYSMTKEAFKVSEYFNTPVILRTTTRISHSYSGVHRQKNKLSSVRKCFEKSNKWISFPELSYENHKKIEKRFKLIENFFEGYSYYESYGEGKILFITSGINYEYLKEAITYLDLPKEKYILLKAATIPIPETIISEVLKTIDKIIVIEELDYVIEKYLYYLLGKLSIGNKPIFGKLSGHIKIAGENTIDDIIKLLKKIYSIEDTLYPSNDVILSDEKSVNLCAGCPHRASFYIVKQAMKNKKTIFCGDIGCYTLGKFEPLNMIDTCLCMGASITMGLSMQMTNPKDIVISFIGDSTFFHSGIQGIINGIANEQNLTIVILDNGCIAMTGGQSTPEFNGISSGIPIENVLKGIGVEVIKTLSPFDFNKSIKVIKQVVELKGIKVVIFRSPCILNETIKKTIVIDKMKCNKCKSCISQIGCPALKEVYDSVEVDIEKCNGCGLCLNVCNNDAIFVQEKLNE